MADGSLTPPEHRSGIYEIVNTINGKRYAGSAALIKRRWKSHRTTLRGNRHHCTKLQRAWNKYGEAAFAFRVLLVCEPEDLLMYEQISFDALKPEYNLAPAAGSCLGVKHREDAKTRTQPRMKGLTHSDETREKIAAAHRGRKHPPEFGAAISVRNTGVPRPKSAEHRQKISQALMGRSFNAGIPKTEAHKAKLSAARKGVPNPKNVGNKSRTGMKSTPEVIERQRAGLRESWARRKAAELVRNEEAIAKQAASMKATWARKKAARLGDPPT